MSDGPHKSLPMSPSWREFSKRGHQRSYEPCEISEALEPALQSDWKDEGCDRLVSQISKLSAKDTQLALFVDQSLADIEALRRGFVGKPMARLLSETVIDRIIRGDNLQCALQAGAEAALKERSLRGIRSCEEHWLRSESEVQTNHMRRRLQAAVDAADFSGIGRRLLGNNKSLPSNASVVKRNGLEDGVRLDAGR